MSIAEKFGYQQDSGVYGPLAIELDESTIVGSRQKMFGYIDAFVKHRIEHFFIPMIGDLLVNSVRGFSSTFTPIESMKTALLAETNEEDAERHMIAFLHEVQSGLSDAIEKYKAEYPRYLLPTDAQTYVNGKSLLSESDEAVLLAVLPGSKNLTYATGPIGEYFRNFMHKCYERSQTLLALSKRFDGAVYENLSVPQITRMAQVINGEIGGLKIENLDTRYANGVSLYDQEFPLLATHDPVHVAYEDIATLILSTNGRNYATNDVDDAMKLTNMGMTAMVALVGSSTSRTEVAINRADYSVRTGLTTPSEHLFTKGQIRAGIAFEVMEKPQPQSLAPIELEVGDRHVLPTENLFTGKFINKGLTLNSVDGEYIGVVYDREAETVTISAAKAGVTTFRLKATNPAGSQYTPVEVVISPAG